MTEQKNYENNILKVITPFMGQKNITLTELARKAQGVTPIDLFGILGDKIELIKNKKPYSEQSISYPEPNPIDFDWRFTEETSKSIANAVESNSKSIGCFGVPSVFCHLMGKSDVKLFDINPFLFEDFNSFNDNIVLIDLDHDSLEGYNFDIIIMDPPWYLDSYANWFKQAINNLKLGGRIYTTIIPPLVRPNAISEWNELMFEFKEFVKIENYEMVVDYETPFFEHETFDTLGLGYVGNWRNTKLNVFQLVSRQIFEINRKEKKNWKRYRFGNKVVSLKITDDELKVLINSPYSDGSYTLKSVSNRDIIRDKVNFITSRNKALVIQGTKKVDIFLQRLSINHDFNKSIDSIFCQDEIEGLKIIHSIIGL